MTQLQKDASDSLSRSRERAGVRARELRSQQTDAEALLWSRLRNRQLSGLKFRRQRPIGNFIADFACVEIGLAVELDGGQHVEQAAYDSTREEQMLRAGFRTLRFWNHEVFNETDAAMEKIRQVAEESALTPALSRERERE